VKQTVINGMKYTIKRNARKKENNDFETDKFCRALFYNINAKQIPLKMQHNLRIIIESEQDFDDETLKNHLGLTII